jgi:hypothetical protein
MLGYSFDVRTYKNGLMGDGIVHWSDLANERTPGDVAWLDKLVEEGKATVESNNYYPNYYKVQFREVLSIIESEGWNPPFNSQIRVQNYNLTNVENPLSYDPDEYVIIEVWDQS